MQNERMPFVKVQAEAWAHSVEEECMLSLHGALSLSPASTKTKSSYQACGQLAASWQHPGTSSLRLQLTGRHLSPSAQKGTSQAELTAAGVPWVTLISVSLSKAWTQHRRGRCFPVALGIKLKVTHAR